MVNRIELPKMPEGNAEEQMRAMYSYLYQMAQALNNNLAEIGGAELTDGEQAEMKEALETSAEGEAGAPQEAETLKSLIIKTAKYVKTAIDRYNMKLTGSSTAEGKIGKYVRNTQMDVDVTPEGIQQSFSFQEIIQGLKQYEINAKNYIKAGLLRTVDGIPVYGIAVGKDVVTFAEDGTETYNDGNKVAEFTAEELSFWQNGYKMASYALSGIEFEEDLRLKSGKKLIIDTTNFQIDENGDVTIKGSGELTGTLKAGDWTFNNNGIDLHNVDGAVSQHLIFSMKKNGGILKEGTILLNYDNLGSSASYSFGFEGFYGGVNTGIAGEKPALGTSGKPWGNGYIDNVITSSSRSMKHGIRELEADGERIDRLKPVSFIYNNDPEETRRMGLILEDTQEVMPEICEETGIRYTELIPVLIREIQELRARVSALEAAKGEK